MMAASSTNAPGGRGNPAAGSERKALSSAVVRCITGDIDDQSVVDIISTGASEEQLMRAVMQMPARRGASGDDRAGAGACTCPVTLKVARILERTRRRSFAPAVSSLSTGPREGQQ